MSQDNQNPSAGVPEQAPGAQSPAPDQNTGGGNGSGFNPNAPGSVGALRKDQAFLSALNNPLDPDHKHALTAWDNALKDAHAKDTATSKAEAEAASVLQSPQDLAFKSPIPPGLDHNPEMVSFAQGAVFELGGDQTDFDVVTTAFIDGQLRMSRGNDPVQTSDLMDGLDKLNGIGSAWGDTAVAEVRRKSEEHFEDAKKFVKALPGDMGERVRTMIRDNEISLTPALISTFSKLYRKRGGV
ncbi:hypothetical protein AB1K42_14235 [Roseibium algicola]|uniref:hypothetical protein n=1 Tax=Roseibium algicola TaxID=2857014 RepID=UPI003458AB38